MKIRALLLSLAITIALVGACTAQVTTLPAETTTITATTTVTTATPTTITTTATETVTTTTTETITLTLSYLLEHSTTYQVIKDVEYGRVGDYRLLLDVYLPDEPVISPAPAVIFIHGGGFRAGIKDGEASKNRIIIPLVEQGFVCISIDYRLSGEATFPAAVEDCKCAVRWLKAHAEEYNVNPERIGVIGTSAGGNLSMMVACADETSGLEGDGGWEEFSSQVQAVCSWFGVSDLKLMGEDYEEGRSQDSALIEFIGGLPSELPELYQLASPINHVTGDDPPLLLVHGDMDPVVPIEQSELMYQAYLDNGLQVDFIEVIGAGHGFSQKTDEPISPPLEEIKQMVLEFFLEKLILDI